MKGHIDLPENAGRVGTFTHDESGTPVHIQPVVPANAETGEPLDLASEATLVALGAAVATLNAAASAIKSAVEGLNGKATTINTGAVAGTVELGAASLFALENVTASISNFPGVQTVQGAVDADTGLAQPLTDAQLRVSAVSVVMSESPLPPGAATDATVQALQTILESVAHMNESMQYLLTSILEKMPRVDSADRVMVSHNESSPTVNISASQTLATLTNLANIGNRDAGHAAYALANSGALHLYDNIRVS